MSVVALFAIPVNDDVLIYKCIQRQIIAPSGLGLFFYELTNRKLEKRVEKMPKMHWYFFI
ncbi:hypothetical protein GCM10008968_34570 [Bacillus horti]